MDCIYLNYNCFQRGFDDPNQLKIVFEALACEEIFSRAENKLIKLAWSFMHEDENLLCPFIERKIEVARLSEICDIIISPNKQIFKMARSYQDNGKLSSKDAIHLACSMYRKCNYFITCDYKLIKQSKKLNLKIIIKNPIEYIQILEKI